MQSEILLSGLQWERVAGPGLESNTAYEVRVQVACTDPAASSAFSEASTSLWTLPIPAAAPGSIGISGSAYDTNVTLIWSAGSPNECGFLKWDVVYQEGGSAAWTTAAGCAIMDRGSTNCTAVGLSCDTDYVFRVREACMDAEPPEAVVTLPCHLFAGVAIYESPEAVVTLPCHL